ncbi:putative ATPase N2B isoform X2 [Leptinotarsa decemlineata]|uniref:putative ATPase N2B isoform X2 n=1 Tax=Leptinotarsa decemlineata TaxID=7539 RepID=UPI003D309F4E
MAQIVDLKYTLKLPNYVNDYYGDRPKEMSDENRMLMDDLKMGDQDLAANIFTGDEEIFAFQRTMSRLSEMQSEEYWGKKKKKRVQ